jgi:hypothetical protein
MLARIEVMKSLPDIREKIGEYTTIYHEHFEQGKEIPAMPDLTAPVAEKGLKLVTVPMVNVFDMMHTEWAKGDRERQELVEIFRNPPLNFEWKDFQGSEGQTILYWIIDRKQEVRPEKIDEVLEIVLKRWKEIEARTLAQKRAEELANEAKKSEKSLAETFADRSEVPVVETQPFTWFHPFSALMQNPMPGDIREKGVTGEASIDNKYIIAPGSAFMEAVYALQVGEVGIAVNQPQSAVYVVRIINSSPSEEALREKFQSTNPSYYMIAGSPELGQAFEAWLEDIQNESGFRWVNKPDFRRAEMSGGFE